MTCHPADPSTPTTSPAADDPAITHGMLDDIHRKAFRNGMWSGAATLATLITSRILDGEPRQAAVALALAPFGVWAWSAGRMMLADRLMRTYRDHARRRRA